MYRGYGGFPPYVSQAERKRRAEKHRSGQAKKGIVLRPVRIEGRTIARSFWGRSWCENLESYADLANRLARGRTYARNGSVIHLAVERGRLSAQVVGSALYRVEVTVSPLARKKWDALVARSAGEIASVVEVLQGKLPKTVLDALADRASGLFPSPKEIAYDCSCPDVAGLCKHIAAVLYGVGARLDGEPETFFVLRGVDVAELASAGARNLAGHAGSPRAIAHDELSGLFGIELDAAPASAKPAVLEKKPRAKSGVPTAKRAALRKQTPRVPPRRARRSPAKRS